uniref:Uncharacterized protein n=1 Tax=viral metagenome TaxID=1070528 RepID=A0A6H1ZZK0_9ZZZZ
MDKERLNPEYEFVPQGWNLTWIPNPNYPNRSLEEELQVAAWDKEFIQVWYWLIYQGKDTEGYREPREKKKILRRLPEGYSYNTYWEPEHNSWREANNEEMKIIKEYHDKGEYTRLQEKTYLVKVLTRRTKKEQRSLEREIPIVVSYIDKLPNNWIVKAWRSNE